MEIAQALLKDWRKRHPRRRALPRPSRVRFPVSAELVYSAKLRGLVAEAKQLWRETLAPQVKRLDASRNDDFLDIKRALGDFERKLSAVFSANRVNDILLPTVRSIDRWSQKQVNKSFSKLTSIDLASFDPDLLPVLSSWTDQNAALIRNVEAQIRDNVARAVNDGVVQGKRWEAIVAEVERGLEGKAGVFQSVENRAKLIARDQIATLNGSLTKNRQQNLGVELYTWRDSGDSRVRPEHAALDGRVFSWDGEVTIDGKKYSPAPGGIFPGSEINCRCVAEPYFVEELAA